MCVCMSVNFLVASFVSGTYRHTYIHAYIHTRHAVFVEDVRNICSNRIHTSTIHACIHTYIHTYIHIHTHIHTYILQCTVKGGREVRDLDAFELAQVYMCVCVCLDMCVCAHVHV
jgi:hypothetical protein